MGNRNLCTSTSPVLHVSAVTLKPQILHLQHELRTLVRGARSCHSWSDQTAEIAKAQHTCIRLNRSTKSMAMIRTRAHSASAAGSPAAGCPAARAARSICTDRCRCPGGSPAGQGRRHRGSRCSPGRRPPSGTLWSSLAR